MGGGSVLKTCLKTAIIFTVLFDYTSNTNKLNTSSLNIRIVVAWISNF